MCCISMSYVIFIVLACASKCMQIYKITALEAEGSEFESRRSDQKHISPVSKDTGLFCLWCFFIDSVRINRRSRALHRACAARGRPLELGVPPCPVTGARCLACPSTPWVSGCRLG